MPTDDRDPRSRMIPAEARRPPSADAGASAGPAPDLETVLRRGVDLFNQERFFEAHEIWEEGWRALPGEPASFLHGLIQIAAGFVKLQRGEPRGATLNLEKGRSKIERFAPSRHGLDVRALLVETERWISEAREMAGAARTEYDATRLPRLRLAPADGRDGTGD